MWEPKWDSQQLYAKSTTLKAPQLQMGINHRKGSKYTGSTKLRRGRRTAAETPTTANMIETTTTAARPTRLWLLEIMVVATIERFPRKF